MKNLLSQLVLVAILVMLPLQLLAVVECSDGIDSDAGAGTVIFGLLGVDDRMELAQSFYIDCDAQLTQVACRFFLEDAELNGVPSLIIGDTIQCKILDANQDLVMFKKHIITETPGNHDIVFDFSHQEFMIASGVYHYLISTSEDKYSRLWWGESFVSGSAFFINNDVWTEQGGDFRSHVLWDSDSSFTATDEKSWNSLKASYR